MMKFIPKKRISLTGLLRNMSLLKIDFEEYFLQDVDFEYNFCSKACERIFFSLMGSLKCS